MKYNFFFKHSLTNCNKNQRQYTDPIWWNGLQSLIAIFPDENYVTDGIIGSGRSTIWAIIAGHYFLLPALTNCRRAEAPSDGLQQETARIAGIIAEIAATCQFLPELHRGAPNDWQVGKLNFGKWSEVNHNSSSSPSHRPGLEQVHNQAPSPSTEALITFQVNSQSSVDHL